MQEEDELYFGLEWGVFEEMVTEAVTIVEKEMIT